jgi:L-arabinose isomerase
MQAEDCVNSNYIRVGLFGIGLDTYWPQFEGLEERLKGYLGEIHRRMESMNAEIIDLGLVDSPEKSVIAGERFRKEGVDLVFLYIATYALSSTVLPVVQRANVPVIVLNLQPSKSIDYKTVNALGDRGKMTGEWLAYCQACSLPEIACVFQRSKIPFRPITGFLQDQKAWKEIEEWIDAARVRQGMRNNRLGILGHYYGGMLDVYTDVTVQCATFGGHVEMLEMDELKLIRDGIGEEAVREKLAEFGRIFEIVSECSAAELDRAARTSCALDTLVKKHRLGSLAYYYEGTVGNPSENIVTSVIAGNTLLTARHVPVAGECEVKNAQAMKILDLFDTGGSFSEFYGMDFEDDVVLLGHDGPAHPAIAEGKVSLVPLPVYHGKPGNGLSIQMSVKHGEVTVLSVCEGPAGVYLLVAEGESVAGDILNIGNTNSRYRFPLGAREFVNQWTKAGPAHHCAIGIGHIAGRIEKFADLAGIPVRIVC